MTGSHFAKSQGAEPCLLERVAVLLRPAAVLLRARSGAGTAGMLGPRGHCALGRADLDGAARTSAALDEGRGEILQPGELWLWGQVWGP